MQRTQALLEESNLEKEKRIKYKGTARIGLEWLYFREKELDFTHVQKLRSLFRKDCRRLDARNHVPAIIDQHHLDSALRVSGIREDVLFMNSQHNIPELVFWPGYQLECLHGRHRIQAAKQVLSSSNKWWTVDLYLADISSELKTTLTEEYANEGQSFDGEAYRKIREYHVKNQRSNEARWWARLSPHKSRNLKQLLQHKDFTAAFDSLLEVPALLEGMRISTLHKMFAIRCDEEILHYLRHIKDFWFNLLRQDKVAMKNIDSVTVKALELTAPWASTADAQILRGKVLGGEVFCSFSQQEREEIWIQLQTFKGLIPSLYGFFEDIKLLEAWSNCLKWTICLSPRDTVSTALKDIFTGVNQDTGSALVQETETLFKTVSASFAYQRDLACRQLWAFAMRYHREIPRRSCGKDLLAKPMVMLNTAKLRELIDLANRLGFEPPAIRALQQYSRSQETPEATGNNRPMLVTDGPGETRRERCGMPHIQSYEEDRKFLFITHLHDDRNEQSEGITSFFRLRSVYMKFYGMPCDVIDTAIDSSSQQHLSTRINESQLSNFHPAQSISLERMNIDEEQPEVDVNMFVELEREQSQMRQQIEQEANTLREQEQGQGLQRQALELDQSTLETAKQEQSQMRQQIEQEANTLRDLEQEQGRQRQALELDQSTLETAKQEQVHIRQQLERDANTLRDLEQEQGRQRQALELDQSTLETMKQEQAQFRHKLEEDVSALRKLEQEQEQSHRKLAIDEKELINRQEKQNEQLLALVRQAREPVIQEQSQNQQQQGQLVQYESGTSLEQEERNMENLQRQGQDELADLETSSPSELRTQASYANQIIDEASADGFHEIHDDDGDRPQEEISPLKPSSEDDSLPRERSTSGEHPTGEYSTGEHSTSEERPTPEERPTGEHSTLIGEHQNSTGERSIEEHPTGEHPTGEHPTGEHPTGEHPTGEHITVEHPTLEGNPTPEDNLPQEEDQPKERHAKRGPDLEEIDDSEALQAQQIREGRKPLRNKFRRLSGYPLYRINYEGNTFIDDTE